jgi:phospholipid transport system substrate-binding protein
MTFGSRFKTALPLACLMMWGLAAQSMAAPTCPAGDFVLNAGAAMQSAARSRSPSAFAGVAARYTDLRGIALFALGPHRSRLGKGEEGRYVNLTKGFIGRFMAKNASRVAGSGLKITDCKGSGANYTVTTQMANGKRFVFRIGGKRGGYRVRDVNVSSVWLAQQLRSSFTGVIRRNNGDIGALYAYLQN